MADEQTPPQPTQINIGQVTPQQVPQQAAAPPNAEAIIAAQQAQLAAQIQEAQARDRATFGEAAPGTQAQPAPALGGALIQGAQQPQPVAAVIGNIPQGQSAAQLAAGIPRQSFGVPQQAPGVPQQGPGAPQQGMTPEQQQIAQLQSQILAMKGPEQIQPSHVQGAPQFAQHNPQAAPTKPTIRWHPGRNSDIKIELTDVIIAGIPETINGEPDPQAKIVAALFSEILTLRARLQSLEENGIATAAPPGIDEQTNRRITMLEMTLTQQTQALTQGARAMREEATRAVLAEQQVNAGQPGGTPVVDPSLNPVNIQAQPAPQPQTGPTGATAAAGTPAGANGADGSTGAA